jgi:uncharacterized protein
MTLPYIYIQQTAGKGRGMFTSESIPANTIIEIAPVIIMQYSDRQHLDKTLLHDYIFEWGTNQSQCCMALGCVPIYNHCYSSNCEYIMDYENDTIIIKTIKKIKANHELTINYNGDHNIKTKVWFDTV